MLISSNGMHAHKKSIVGGGGANDTSTHVTTGTTTLIAEATSSHTTMLRPATPTSQTSSVCSNTTHVSDNGNGTTSTATTKSKGNARTDGHVHMHVHVPGSGPAGPSHPGHRRTPTGQLRRLQPSRARSSGNMQEDPWSSASPAINVHTPQGVPVGVKHAQAHAHSNSYSQRDGLAKPGFGHNRYGSVGLSFGESAAMDDSEPIGEGVIRICMKSPYQLFGLDGFLSPQQAYLSTAICHAPGTRLLAIHRSLIEELLADPDSKRCQRVRAHLGEQVLESLSSAPWMRGLNPTQFQLLTSIFDHATIEPNTVLFRSGECTVDVSPFYILLEGTVEVSFGDDRGKTVTRVLESGSIFGDLAVVLGICRTGTVRTLKRCTVRFIQRRWFTLFLRTFPSQHFVHDACRILLKFYPIPIKDEQMLEQMDLQAAFARHCLKSFSAENNRTARP